MRSSGPSVALFPFLCAPIAVEFSLSPQATKVYLAKKPTHAVGFFVSENKQSSRPVHFWSAACFEKFPSLLPLPMVFPEELRSPVNGSH